MTYIFRTSLLVFCFLFIIVVSSSAQTNLLNASNLSEINIDQYSNEEIAAFYSKAKEAGLDDQQLYSILLQKGLSQYELDKLKNRLLSIVRPKNLENRQYFDSSNEIDRRFDSTLGKIKKQSFDFDSSIFGSELFSSASLAFEPNLRIPAPSNYILGPDDEIVISVYGYSEKKYTLTINEQGEIYIPNVGPVMLSGFTLEEATDKIKNKLASTIYTAIRSGQTKVQVSLGHIRSVRATVIGQAKKPGTYTVSSLTTLYNLLYLCGGPNEMGSYRNIEIIRGKEKRHADLYDFLVYGNQKDNILLKEGDVIRIPYYENRVTISGKIKRPGKFEMLNGETFFDLLNYSGGFMDAAYRGAVSVERLSDSIRKMIDLSSSDYKTFNVKGSDKYFVRKLQEEFGNRVYVTGSIQRSGPYEFVPGMGVKDLINKAGGLTVDAYTKRALIYRYLPNKLPAMKSVDLDSVYNLGEQVLLEKNDSLVIHSIFYLRDKNNIRVEGYVRQPQDLEWRNNLTLKDVLVATGGISSAGDSTKIEISRRISNADIMSLNHQETEVIIVDLTTQSADLPLHPYDVVIVKEKPGFVLQRSVLVQGEVLRPGKYALENSRSKVLDVLNRTGGFKASADSNSVTIRRITNYNLNTEERKQIFQRVFDINQDSLENNLSIKNELYKSFDLISINLNNAIEHPESSDNLMLEDGDIISVSRSSDLVKVSGEVYFPTITAYRPGKNLKYYVQQAGNFMPRARKNGSLVIYPNGKVKSVKHFLFFKFYPEVIPRSEIFIPQKDKSNKTRISTAEWALIISALGIASNVIINITK